MSLLTTFPQSYRTRQHTPPSHTSCLISIHSAQFSSVTQSCPTLCNPIDCSMPALPLNTNSQSLPKLMSIESVMPSNHLILCHPRLFLPSIFPSISLFKWVSSLHQVAKVLWVSASTSVLPMNTQGWSPLGWTLTRCQMMPQHCPSNTHNSPVTQALLLPHIYKWEGHNREARVQTQAVQT